MIQKKHFWPFFALLLVSCLMFGTIKVYAAPVVSVTVPNGGEILSGISTIYWNASDSGNSQTLTADLNYSTISGGASDSIVSDLNLLQNGVCAFPDIAGLWVQQSNFTNGLIGSPGVFSNGQMVVFSDNGKLIYLAGSKAAFDWNGTQWNPNYDYNKGLIYSSSGSAEPVFKTFSDFGDGTTYLFVTSTSGSVHNIQSYSWSGSQWIPAYDKNNGLGDFGAYGLSFDLVKFEGKVRLYVDSSSNNAIKTYDWNGVGWDKTDYLKGIDIGYGNLPDFYAFFFNGGQLARLRFYPWSPNITPFGEYFQNGFWVGSSDLNRGILPVTGTPEQSNVFDYNGQKYVALMNKTGSTINDLNFYYYITENVKQTSISSTCSYPWDTRTVPDHLWYWNATVSNGSTTANDVSNAQFTILNYSSSDLNVVCVENCSVAGFDGNGIVINPTNEGQNLKFYVQNNSVQKGAFLKINNSLNDGKRYFVYTTEPSSSDGNYSMDYQLTYGNGGANTHTDGIQKIWDSANSRFVYTITEPNLTSSQKKYYLVKYQKPAKQWNTIKNSLDWDIQNVPDNPDLNGITVDVYQTASNAQISDELKQPIPNTVTTPTRNDVFLFTAKALAGSNTLRAGIIPTKGSIPNGSQYSAAIDGTEITYDFDTIDNGILALKTLSGVSTIQIYDYALVSRSFFLKPVEIKDSLGQTLPPIISDGRAWQFVREGEKYRVQTQIYDQNGDITKIEIFTYLETVNDANLANYVILDYAGKSSPESTINLDYNMPGISDFTTGNKSMLVKVRVTDAKGYSEVSSQWLKLVQFPYFAGDFSIKNDVINITLASQPKIFVYIRDIRPETLRGVNVYFHSDGNEANKSDYNKTFYVGTDFSCRGFDCSFEYQIPDWVIPYTGVWNFTASALLTTQNEDYNSLLTAVKKTFLVKTRDFETIRVFEAIDRQPTLSAVFDSERLYRNDEEIGFVLQVRDKNPAINFKDILDVHFNLWDCTGNTGDNCLGIAGQSITPDKFLYDERTGYNYYFVKRIWTDYNGALLADGNYYRISASVHDRTEAHGDTTTTLLVAKCASYLAILFANTFNVNPGYTAACNVNQDPVITDANEDREIRVKIDNSITPDAPSINAVYCVRTKPEESFVDPLDQEQLCAVIYSMKEQIIDKFDFTISNNNSDFSKKGKSAQYLTVSVPYSQILFNDLELTKQTLQPAKDRQATTIGELLFQGFISIGAVTTSKPLKYMENYLGCCRTELTINTASCLAGLPEALFGSCNIDENIPSFLVKNFEGDYNLTKSLSPTNLNGIIFLKLKGLKTINIQDYLEANPDLNMVDTKDFLEYMNYIETPIEIPKSRIEIFGNGNQKFYSTEIESPLVINEEQSIALRKKPADSNMPNYASVLVPINFNFITDLIYNNEFNGIRKVVSFTLFDEITPTQNIFDSMLYWLFPTNWFFILIALLLIAYAGDQYVKFSKRGD